MIDNELLKILACPACKKNVILKNQEIVCTHCGRIYPIKDDVPIMLVEEAKVNEKEEKK